MSLRIDRLASLYVVNPLLKLRSAESSIPILMYHSISDKDEARTHAYYRTKTAPQVFAAQMEYLHHHGYSTCGLADVLDCLKENRRIATNYVAITFDDGYRDFYTQAFPVMNRHGFSATVFLPTSYIAEAEGQLKNRECLNWAEVRELQKCGISFGSHTVTHPQLRKLSPRAIDEEIVNSKQTIEEKTGCAVRSFAYPFAFPQTETNFTGMLRESLHKAGYQNGVCTIVGRASRHSDPFFMERLPVNSCDDEALFEAKLAGAYDWIAKPQRYLKLAKSRAARLYWQG